MTSDEIAALRPELGRLQQIALAAGVVGLALCGLGAFLSLSQFYQAYLFAYMFWLGLALGSFAIMMLQYLTGGRWGVMLRRMLESGALTLPLMALLFLPFVFGLQQLYSWARPEELAQSELLQVKQPYLNPLWFIGRALLFFLIWIGLALLINRWSRDQDRTAHPGLARRLQLISGLGLVLYVLTLSLAVTDWVMSLDYTWFSSIYGMLFIVGQGLSTLAFMTIMLALLIRRPPFASLIKPGLFHDLGTLIFAFVVLWAYMSFSQYLIVWSGNIAEEVPWYLRRSEGGWNWLAVALMIFHFALPFFLLLLRRIKQSARLLTIIAIGIIVMRLIDLYWLTGPEFYANVLGASWVHLAALLGIGGIWLALFIWLLDRRPFLPLHATALEEAIRYE